MIFAHSNYLQSITGHFILDSELASYNNFMKDWTVLH